MRKQVFTTLFFTKYYTFLIWQGFPLHFEWLMKVSTPPLAVGTHLINRINLLPFNLFPFYLTLQSCPRSPAEAEIPAKARGCCRAGAERPCGATATGLRQHPEQSRIGAADG